MYRDVSLEDRYAATGGTVLLSGVQALVRATLDQRRHDRAVGLRTAAYVSGYQGSPLGGVEREMGRAAAQRDELGVVFQPSVNEELAATAVAGTQLLGELDRRRVDGVTGWWFGKAPGLDRAADAIRHANVSGTAPLGGAVAWIGDDPSAKSSSVPSSSEPLCRSLYLPVLAPGTVQEVLDFSLHAAALSRHAGSWAAVKVVADIADATATVELGTRPPALAPRPAFSPATMLPPTNLVAEHDLVTERLARASAYAREAQLNRVVVAPRRARMAVVAAGMSFQAVLRAVDDLGLDCETLGLRLVRLGMPWPLDRAELRELLGGVETVLVVEDKLPFVETLVKEALYRTPAAPLVLGKEDADGRELLSPRSALGADDVARALGRLLPADALPDRALARLALLDRPAEAPAVPRRTPYFCSGCPHTTSTRADADQLVGAGIGCHIMVALESGRDGVRGHLLGMPQMGGEGAQWLGLAPFTDDEHFVQNLGDGTFFHSGSLAIRAAIAAGATMTFRLLHNDVVAMTGGQTPQGQMDIPALTRWLELEGVRRTIITTPERDGYRGVKLAANASVRPRDELDAVQRELEAEGGVTVLLHDDQCATEKRRLRKRGKLPSPAQRVVIDERVCEGCGDCGDTSSCLSVQPVQTEFGRKTRIHQSSCNQDFSCTDGDCPSFLLVTPGATARRETPAPPACDPPVPRVGADVTIRMPGVGGTGVVTLSQILEMAAHIEGRHTAGVEQIGLAQKGGPVLSDIRISERPIAGQLRATAASVDVLLGLDPLGAAAPETLLVCDPARTRAVVNTGETPTAAMVTDPRVPFSHASRALARVRDAVAELHDIDALALSARLFDDHMPANMLVVGAAFQHGLLPLGEHAIERAIALNGAAVETNLAAFRWGRAAAAHPAAVASLLGRGPISTPVVHRDVRALLDAQGVTGELRRLLDVRAAELTAYQDVTLAADYVREVLRVAAVERARVPGSTSVAEAYARGLHKLLAPKDEYEVARLHAASAERFERAARVELLLHPPVLRSLGMRRKLHVNGRLGYPAMRLLARGKRLRGTALDPFGRTAIRRLERALPGEYRDLVDTALASLRPDTVGTVTAIAELPDLIRGYEEIKLRGVEAFRARAAELLTALAAPSASAGSAALPIVRHRPPRRPSGTRASASPPRDRDSGAARPARG